MSVIASVEVELDYDTVREDCVITIKSVISKDSSGEEKNHYHLTQLESYSNEELINGIADCLDVDSSIIRIMSEIAEIASVEVYLDDNLPEMMSGIIRAGSVVSKDSDGNEIKNHQELVCDVDCHSEDELKSHVARKLNVDRSIISIIELVG